LLLLHGLQVVPCTKEKAACPNAGDKDENKCDGSSKIMDQQDDSTATKCALEPPNIFIW
jgi:hypothetical protein